MPKPPTSHHAPLLNVEQVALRLGVCCKTVRRWIESGALHAHRIGRPFRVSEDDLDTFLAKHRR